MGDFQELLAHYDYLIRRVIRHMRIYDGFEEFYHVATIALWQAQVTYCVERCTFEKYAFLQMKYALAAELTRQNREAHVFCTDEAGLFEQAHIEQEDFSGEWFLMLSPEEQQLLRWIFVMGYTNHEVAQRWQLTEEAVKKRRQRLLQKLKNRIKFS